MPLSEHEQRLLEQIEQALYAEDPKFAHTWRTRDLHSVRRTRVVRALVVFVAGLGLLLAGVITKIIPMGVAGFVLMLGGASLAVAATQRFGGRREAAAGGATPLRRRRRPGAGRPGGARPKTSLLQRLEHRWQRRQDNR